MVQKEQITEEDLFRLMDREDFAEECSLAWELSDEKGPAV